MIVYFKEIFSLNKYLNVSGPVHWTHLVDVGLNKPKIIFKNDNGDCITVKLFCHP